MSDWAVKAARRLEKEPYQVIEYVMNRLSPPDRAAILLESPMLEIGLMTRKIEAWIQEAKQEEEAARGARGAEGGNRKQRDS